MLNMRGCFATLSSSRGATQGEARECWPRPGEMLPAACREEGGVQRSQRFSEERQMKADGAKSQSSIPQPSLGDYSSLPLMLNVVWLSAFVSLANIIQDRAEPSFSGQRGGGQVCVCHSCDGCCDVNKVQQPRVSRWTGGGAVTMVIMSVSHLWWEMRSAVWTLSSCCNVMSVMSRVISNARVTRPCYLSCDYWDTRHEVTGRDDISHDNLRLWQKTFSLEQSWRRSL